MTARPTDEEIAEFRRLAKFDLRMMATRMQTRVDAAVERKSETVGISAMFAADIVRACSRGATLLLRTDAPEWAIEAGESVALSVSEVSPGLSSLPIPEGMETTAEERAHWLNVYAGRTFHELPMLLRTLRDHERALTEVARLDETLTLAKVRVMDLEEEIARLTAERAAVPPAVSDIAKEYLEGLRARIAELEAKLTKAETDVLVATAEGDARLAAARAANAICRTDIEALMRSADSLEAANAELETKWAHTVDALRAANERNTELEAENALLKTPPSGIEGHARYWKPLADALKGPFERIAKLEAERDRLLIAEEDAKLFIFLHALAIEQGYMPDPGESAYDLLQRAIMTRSPRALSDPSGE